MNLFNRRLINSIIFVAIVLALSIYYNKVSQTLTDSTIITGWMLFGLMILLTLYNIRKKFTFLPLGASSTWLQLHIYAGLLTFVLFLFHTGFKWPNGQLETIISIMYYAVAISGLIGLIMSRTFPRRLSSRKEEYIFERIPLYRKTLREKAEKLATSSIATTSSGVVAEFYRDEIAEFLEQPRHLFHHFWESRRPLIQILRKMNNVSRYMNDKEKEVVDSLSELVEQKYDLDYSLCLQGCLKFWLFVHIPFTYGLMIFTILHVILVYAFTGGMS